MDNYIYNQIAEVEHQQLDYKFEISDSRTIAKTLSAFANTDGGKLLVGVKDNGAIAGVRSEEEFFMIEGAAQLYCKPEVNFTVREWKINKRIVLEIDIPKDKQKRPVKAVNKEGKWLSYIRVNDQNLLANSVLLKVWKRKKQESNVIIEFTEKERILLQYIHKFDSISLSKFCKIAYLPRHVAEKILVNFIVLDIIDIVFTEKNTYYKFHKNFDISNIYTKTADN